MPRRECNKIFLTLSMFALELKSCGRHEPHTVKICRLIPRQLPNHSMTPCACDDQSVNPAKTVMSTFYI
jgi:hypothetical protein